MGSRAPGLILRSEDTGRHGRSLPTGCMTEKISLKELHDAGRSQALEAAVSLVGLGRQETLARIADLREALARRKAALAGAGFALDEIQAWEDGYIAGLLERGGGWLAYSGAGAMPGRK